MRRQQSLNDSHDSSLSITSMQNSEKSDTKKPSMMSNVSIPALVNTSKH